MTLRNLASVEFPLLAFGANLATGSNRPCPILFSACLVVLDQCTAAQLRRSIKLAHSRGITPGIAVLASLTTCAPIATCVKRPYAAGFAMSVYFEGHLQDCS